MIDTTVSNLVFSDRLLFVLSNGLECIGGSVFGGELHPLVLAPKLFGARANCRSRYGVGHRDCVVWSIQFSLCDASQFFRGDCRRYLCWVSHADETDMDYHVDLSSLRNSDWPMCDHQKSAPIAVVNAMG